MTIRALPARQLMGRALIAASLAFSGTAVLPGAPAAAAGSVTYVDCSRATAGDGSQTAPFNSVGQANGKAYGPGDTLAFASGTTCTGALAPRGSGTAAAPIALTAYGTGALPVIDGAGAPDTVSLTNQDHWRISNLKLTNPASTVARRTGLRISATDGTAHRGYDIGNLVIDRVAGQTNKNSPTTEDFVQSAGIVTGASGTNSTLNDVHVHDNQISNTGGGGLKIRVGAMAVKGTGVLIEDNTVKDVGGDGIIASYADAPLIQYNNASGVGNGVYPFSGGNFAGIWVLGDHNPTIQRNAVYGITRMSVADSQAFDCDWGNTGTCTIQYNFSRDNIGGFFLDCDGCGTIGGAQQVIRYNISENDCRMSSVSAGRSALHMYNNVLYCTDKKFSITLPDESVVENNIWVGTTDSRLPTAAGISWLWNVFQGVPRPTANGIAGDPQFVNPGTGGDTIHSVDGYKLRATSPGLNNGSVISGNGGRDYWGNPVSATAKPHRGAYNGPGL
ncbi:right-handed parallel beta-helix repeat-containing protein [Streptomyces tanashiensis]|uniref:Right-handed parallel beta-helix repeat-containing protein n=1 Tax=Streptomyces tanashiensis TaxID=67367 RepID=A0ABY6QU02_9ACTN|nr:right-handed parallel beta-helix repeat-containing protein [Streptomyces tanashiensis]UZX19994.1 right-handed parallel beta-helix repeat-containing protein [Streptomyces tanashiensis]